MNLEQTLLKRGWNLLIWPKMLNLDWFNKWVNIACEPPENTQIVPIKYYNKRREKSKIWDSAAFSHDFDLFEINS